MVYWQVGALLKQHGCMCNGDRHSTRATKAIKQIMIFGLTSTSDTGVGFQCWRSTVFVEHSSNNSRIMSQFFTGTEFLLGYSN